MKQVFSKDSRKAYGTQEGTQGCVGLDHTHLDLFLVALAYHEQIHLSAGGYQG